MVRSTANNIADEVARFGIHRVRGVGHDRHKTAWEVKCGGCGIEYRAYWQANSSPELMIKNMRQRKWNVGKGDRPLCPDCDHPGKDHSPLPKSAAVSDAPHIAPLPKTALAQALVTAGVQLVVGKEKPKPSWDEYRAKLQMPPSQELLATAELGTLVTKALDKLDSVKMRRDEAVQRVRELRLAGLVKARAIRSARALERRERAEARKQAAAEERLAAPWVRPAPVTAPITTTTINEEKKMNIEPRKTPPSVAPKITHSVFQALDAYFDGNTRLYTGGYDDARVAKECGTTEDIVAYLRRETFGELAEDPRIASIRADIDRIDEQAAVIARNLVGEIKGLRSRLDQVAANLKR